MNRRELLGTIGASTVALTGCLGSNCSEGETAIEAVTGDEREVRMGGEIIDVNEVDNLYKIDDGTGVAELRPLYDMRPTNTREFEEGDCVFVLGRNPATDFGDVDVYMSEVSLVHQDEG